MLQPTSSLLPAPPKLLLLSRKQVFWSAFALIRAGLSEDFDGNVVWKQRPLNREMLSAIHDEMLRLLGDEAKPDFIKICPHAKKIDCACRKPKAVMLLAAAAEFDVDLSRSYMIGDMVTDIKAGIAAGVTPIFVASGFEPEQLAKCPQDTLNFPSLVEAAALIIRSV